MVPPLKYQQPSYDDWNKNVPSLRLKDEVQSNSLTSVGSLFHAQTVKCLWPKCGSESFDKATSHTKYCDVWSYTLLRKTMSKNILPTTDKIIPH